MNSRKYSPPKYDSCNLMWVILIALFQWFLWLCEYRGHCFCSTPGSSCNYIGEHCQVLYLASLVSHVPLPLCLPYTVAYSSILVYIPAPAPVRYFLKVWMFEWAPSGWLLHIYLCYVCILLFCQHQTNRFLPVWNFFIELCPESSCRHMSPEAH